MKIAAIYASNVKRLKVAQLTINGNSFLITGDNENGKTSLLNSFWYALGGKEAIPNNVITNGADKTEIYLDLTENFRIERIITPIKTELKVRPLLEPNATLNSPQAICDALIGEFTFDPEEFENKDIKDQVDILKKFLPDGNNLSQIDQQIQIKFSARSEINKELKKNDLRLKSMKQPEVNLPNKEISVAELSKQKEQLERELENYNDLVRDKTEAENSIRTSEGKLANNEMLFSTFSKMEESTHSLTESLLKVTEVSTIIDLLLKGKVTFLANQKIHSDIISQKQKEYDQIIIPEKKDWSVLIAKLREQIETAEETNVKIRYRNEYAKVQNDAQDAKIKADQYTNEIEELRKQRIDIFKNANFPVEGLTFDEEGIYLDGMPFINLSDSKKILVSMKIGMGLNPKLKVIFIKHGNDIGVARMKTIFQIAEKEGYQIIIERIDPIAGFPYVVLEDGIVTETNFENSVPHLNQSQKSKEDLI